MKSIKSLADSSTIAVLPSFKCDAGGASFEVVGDALVSQDFMIILTSAIEDKIDLFSNVILIPELLGKGYYESLNDEERVVVGACIVKLIEQQRVSLHPDSITN